VNSGNEVLVKKATGKLRNRWEKEEWEECRQIAVYKNWYTAARTGSDWRKKTGVDMTRKAAEDP
jgi:hypothetical protein